MASNHHALAISSGDLVDLVSSSGSATIYPSDDAILAVLQARFRSDLPYTRIGCINLLVVNPYKILANVNDVSAKEYEERCYKDTSLPVLDAPRPLHPHLYDVAARVYLLMRRRNETQAVVTRGITGSGKSSSQRLFLNQILRLSAYSKKELKLAEQIKALGTVLDSFGNAKTLMNPNASRQGRYLELHFNERGRISAAKVLTFGLDKTRLNRLSHEERTYHVFYQFLAGTTAAERDHFNLEDVSDYALLASSGCYRLPSGPFSDDSIAMAELRVAMRTLGFKPKHMTSIFSLLVAILLLGNLQFAEGDAHDVSAHVSNPHVLDQVARLLGVSPDELGQVFTNKTNYVRKELFTVLLNAENSGRQRDQCVRDLYAILVAYVVETSNHRLAPAKEDPPCPQIILFDQPGFQTRGPAGTSSMSLSGTQPLISAYGQNGFDEFCVNFADEMLQSYVLRHTFEDSIGYDERMVQDGVALPSISTMDNGACIELLRGAQLSERSQKKPGGLLGVIAKACSSYKSGKDREQRDEELLKELTSKFTVHASFVTERNLFGINHYAGAATYDVTHFVEKDTDLVDSAFVSLLRNSSDGFVSKLLSGPSLAAERHSKDDQIIVQAQVSSRPLRNPSPVLSPNNTPPAAQDEHPHLDPANTYPVTSQLNFTLSQVFASLERAKLWTISCIRPNDSGSPNSFDKRRVKAQIRSLLLPDLTARKTTEYVADYNLTEFCERYVPTMRGSEQERIVQCARANGWKEGEDYVCGTRNIWLSYEAWKTVEDILRNAEKGSKHGLNDEEEEGDRDDYTDYTHQTDGGLIPPTPIAGYFSDSADNLLLTRTGNDGTPYQSPNAQYDSGVPLDRDVWSSEYDKKDPGIASLGYSPHDSLKESGDMVVKEAPNTVVEVPSTKTRRFWLWLVWLTTWWIPNFMLRIVGRMKRPDIRLAWREKVTIFSLIFLFNALVLFYIVEFGRLLCPNFDKAWNANEVAQHQGSNDYWVSIHGIVYDLSNFINGDHSNGHLVPSNSPDVLDALAGLDLSYYFPPPLVSACSGLVSDGSVSLTYKNFTDLEPSAIHLSGRLQTEVPDLENVNWYKNTFLAKLETLQKGPLVLTKQTLAAQAADTNIAKIWGSYSGTIYDLTDYIWTLNLNLNSALYQFLDPDLVAIFQQRSGQDVTQPLNVVLGGMNSTYRAQNMECLNNVFVTGSVDFRKSARCQVQNWLLIFFSALLVASVAVKFLAALQLGSTRFPELQDKFVLCQVPCYTEGEESLRRTIDSLASLNYDDKRKLIFIICDGNIIGSGNDRTTPRIVLDLLGVDPKFDPEPLLFKSVGEGSKALNYGKVYSGLYEFEGHVVPYMVIVKIGKPTERSKPGNRGKRDSQVLLLHYLNRVHFDLPMSPLELEIYHQMRNVIGIDPAFYEYIFTVDADTTVTPDSLNRLVASSADDSKIIGICGETKLTNEEGSWWTMIQVYEYYISHHLSKAFESLFGSVTCLPGCFSLYRVRTADKGRPIIISNRIIEEYAEPNVDTLHKKNLFSLGEDRFLTTLLMKHFPTFKTKFCPDAVAHTLAPESWRVLFSQRRRWINSTVHNLCELAILPELLGFCCFSLRFFVLLDLVGTIILPATVVYLVYLVIVVSTHASALPQIAIIMLAVTYGLQATIFIIKREFMLVGWMVVYLISYPVYSFFLPIYAFWCMDEFGWGNTRLIIGEGKDKKVIVNDDEKFDDSMIPLKKFSEYEAEAWETGTRHSDDTGYDTKSRSHSQIPRSRDGSPHPFNQQSQTGDYYRDTNITYNNSSNPNLRLGGSQLSHSNVSHIGAQPQLPSYGASQLPFMPLGGGPGSLAGSDYGHLPPMAMIPQLGYQNTGSVYGMVPPNAVPRNTVMSGLNMLGSGGSMNGSVAGGVPPSLPPLGGGLRPMSSFSMATSVNPFAGPSMNPNPSDEELFNALRNYLSTQDLMTVTKKTAREAIMARFPKADLVSRKDFLNQSIDKILSES